MPRYLKSLRVQYEAQNPRDLRANQEDTCTIINRDDNGWNPDAEILCPEDTLNQGDLNEHLYLLLQRGLSSRASLSSKEGDNHQFTDWSWG